MRASGGWIARRGMKVKINLKDQDILQWCRDVGVNPTKMKGIIRDVRDLRVELTVDCGPSHHAGREIWFSKSHLVPDLPGLFDVEDDHAAAA